MYIYVYIYIIAKFNRFQDEYTFMCTISSFKWGGIITSLDTIELSNTCFFLYDSRNQLLHNMWDTAKACDLQHNFYSL